MDDSTRIQLAQYLHMRRDSVARAWYEAVAPTGFAPFSPAEVRRRLTELTDQAISFLLDDVAPPDEARAIGVALARLRYTRPEALGRTQGLLACELLRGLGADQTLALLPNLAALLEGVATGFSQQAVRIQLAEQESIRAALVSELAAAQVELRRARDRLEEQVQQRTAELRASEARWQSLVTGAPDVIFTLDSEGRIRFVNHIPAGADFGPQDVLGRCPWEMAAAEHRQTVRAAIEGVLATGISANYEAAVRRANGAVVWYAVYVGPLHPDEGGTTAMMIARDITEHKRMEELKDNLIRDVSHELRAPLARAAMSLELLLEQIDRDPIDRPAAVRFGQLASGSVHSLAQMVEAILDLSRLEAGVHSQRRQLIGLADLIAAAVLEMEPLASAKGLRLVVDLAPDLPPVEGDPQALSRVVRNLVDNAVKFSPAGRILVSAHRNSGEVEVSISDEGCGILPENLELVFSRFFRERAEYPGVGVGLPICRAIVEAHGGRIWAESPGRGLGATLRFALPASEPATAQGTAP